MLPLHLLFVFFFCAVPVFSWMSSQTRFMKSKTWSSFQDMIKATTIHLFQISELLAEDMLRVISTLILHSSLIGAEGKLALLKHADIVISKAELQRVLFKR